VIDMRPYPNPGAAALPDFPASYHNGAGGLSFADGHAEIKKWLDPRTKPKVLKRAMTSAPPQGNNPDVVWLWERTTRREY
jgi:prepilin-type processing-associated H-X9-DG protein